MHIRINDFAGTFPKMHPTKLPGYGAQESQNAMVESGILSPINQASNSHQSNRSGYEQFLSAVSFYHEGVNHKKYSNEIVSFAFSPVHDAYRLYWTTEDGTKPMKFVDWDVSITGELTTDNYEYIAGLPPPDVKNMQIAGITTPSGSPSDSEIGEVFKKYVGLNNSSGVEKKETEISDVVTSVIVSAADDVEARVYALTYVNRFGDESAPGVIEKVFFLTKGNLPTLTIPYSAGEREALLSDYGINAIRLYRSVTNSAGVAQFLFVKEYAITLTGSGVVLKDDLPFGSTKLGEPLVTMNYDPPRFGMKGLGVTSDGVGYGYVGKTVCLSEPYTLYAFPRFYELSTQHDIMGLGHYDNTIVVATTGNPVLIGGSDPENMGALSLPLYEGCVSSRSMVNLNHGCMYASNNGLVLVTTNSAKLLTEQAISAKDWQKINPSSIHASAYKNGYLFFWENGSKNGSGYIDLESGNKGVMWFDDHALNTFLDGNIVKMISKGKNTQGATRSFYATFNPEYGEDFTSKLFAWRSKEFNLDTARRMLAAQVIADDYSDSTIVLSVYANGQRIHQSQVKSARAFRISNHSAKYDFSIGVTSNVPIREIVLAETMRDTVV